MSSRAPRSVAGPCAGSSCSRPRSSSSCSPGGGALRIGDDAGRAAPETRTAQVDRVVDGDTILVLLDGVRERVRYIGIDTPESVAEQPLECYGHRAAEENERLVGGRTVTLTTDEEPRDRFGGCSPTSAASRTTCS